LLAACFALGALGTGCDQGARDDEVGHGPALHLVASYPADGQGTNAAPDADVTCDVPTPDCPVPTNASIQLRFDRFLRPGGGFGAGLRLFSGNPPANGSGFDVEYDLIERVVVFHPTRALQPNTLYTVELVPSTNLNAGFWAFDGAPLREDAIPLSFSFTTGSGPVPPPPRPAARVDTCETMTQGPFASCANCHTTRDEAPSNPPLDAPPMGLDLSTSRGLFYTAVSHVAHQTETGSSANNEGLQTPSRFGVQMNIVDPGNPASSYLMYKLLGKPENYKLAPTEAECASNYHPPVSDSGCSPPDADELTRLREWFVRGEAMPKNGFNATTGKATLASTNHATLVRVADWIASGAACPVPD
jgi:hypothetical protein